MTTGTTSLHKYFKALPDPRTENRSRHLLIDMLVIALLATIAGAAGFNDIEMFGKSKETWLRTFLELPNGIPSHDTFNRIFSMLKPEEFSKCFTAWAQSLRGKLQGVVAIDGKTLRRSFKSAEKRTPLHMVSAWSAENELVLGQIRTEAKSNEITAIPKLIELLDLEGCTVTIDAMGCQTEIAQTILDAKADYLLGLKGNQGNTLDAVKYLFECECGEGFGGVVDKKSEEPDKDHGRIEKREICSIGNLDDIEGLEQWPGLKSVTRVISIREMIGKEATVEERYYLGSMEADAARISAAIRAHWGIENKLHWILDMDLGEDYARNRKSHSAENMAILRHMVINLVKKERSSKASFRGKLLKASWNDDYILQLLALA